MLFTTSFGCRSIAFKSIDKIISQFLFVFQAVRVHNVEESGQTGEEFIWEKRWQVWRAEGFE